ncbi:helix-turn-helix transcriptional regulator [Amycolatopsis sp. NPDC050768]|uniref:helix-turn-helix transcriptional regulator n=1 Tax=Amycolatopsis sp. NPDC050768 TaxID=3154839 RepID=UPI0033EA7084
MLNLPESAFVSDLPVRATETFPEALRRLRKRAGMTQQELADFATLSVRAIRNLEQDRVRRPRAETVKLLADALRLPAEDRRLLETLARGGDVVAEPPPYPPLRLAEPRPRDGEIHFLARLLVEARRRKLVSTECGGAESRGETVIAATRGDGTDGEWRVLWVVSTPDPGADDGTGTSR